MRRTNVGLPLLPTAALGRVYASHYGRRDRRVKLRIVLFATVVWSCWLSVALASTFTTENLGPTVPMWFEHSAGLSEFGDAAWTSTRSGIPRAHVMPANERLPVDLHALLPDTTRRSYAGDVSIFGDRVVGYGATNDRETDRVAYVWGRDAKGWSATRLPGLTQETRQTAAYAIGMGYAGVVIGGYVREAVSSTSLSQPVVWRERGGAWVPTVLPAETYGIVFGVAVGEEPGHRWACGSHGSAVGTYAQAACWDLDSHRRMTLDLGLDPKQVASSVVQRVRQFHVGENERVSLAVGTVTMINGESRGFVYKLRGPSSVPDLQWVEGIADGSTAMLRDVRAEHFPSEGDDARIGWIVAGAGATTPSVAGQPSIVGNPGGTAVAYRGVSKAYLYDTGAVGETCDIQDQSEERVGAFVVALGLHGETRLVWDDGNLFLFEHARVLDEPEILVRNATVTLRPGVVDAIEHFQGRMKSDVADGRISWSAWPGCEPMNGANGVDLR